ncbi:lysoplasmalogenase-like protein TMEM86A isoform X2 [Aplysia californica]|uniref:lysoplasmalogenase n=1 Tax=Aplysia californica TaxID=6500 RepID=A0ABM0JIH3_APLCA|nr:lysoplasmalogenase-like protein TMEM86A isoform X2 [Aplysia californica]
MAASIARFVPQMLARLTQPRILPYYILFSLYLYLYKPYTHNIENDIIAAVFKALPVWYLAFFVNQKRKAASQNQLNISTISESSSTQNGASSSQRKGSDYSDGTTLPDGDNTDSSLKTHPDSVRFQSFFMLGLLVSSSGDISLEFKGCFELGVLFFGIAQILYLYAMKPLRRKSKFAWLVIPLNVVLYSTLITGSLTNVDIVLAGLYSVLIHSMMFYAISSFESLPSPLTAFSALGASSFVLSDFLIGYTHWCAPLVYGEAIIMFSYYIAQVLLTLGVP